MFLHDSVSVELIKEDYDKILSDHFTDSEQYLIYSKHQDFDLNSCMELCDTVETLNQTITETRMDMLKVQFDFNSYLQQSQKLPSEKDTEHLFAIENNGSIKASKTNGV